MKRVVTVFVLVLFLVGCGSPDASMDKAMMIRQKMIESKGCSFDVKIIADYSDALYTFQMHCVSDELGNVSFSVIAPESIRGISGKIENNKGKLTFDDKVLAFELMADGQITPVSTPWVFIKSLRGGFFSSCGTDENGMRITIYDSYEEDALQLDIWAGEDLLPTRAEILYRGRRILTMEILNYIYL